MIDDPVARAHVAAVWRIDPDSLPGKGKSAYELLSSLGEPDGVKALLVFASNIIVSATNARFVSERIDSLDLQVVADIVLSETADRSEEHTYELQSLKRISTAVLFLKKKK